MLRHCHSAKNVLRVTRAWRRSAGFSYVRLDGSTSAKKRKEIIKAFSSAEPGAFFRRSS